MSIGSYSDKKDRRSLEVNDLSRKASFKKTKQMFEQSNDRKTPAPDQKLRKKAARTSSLAKHCHLCKERASDLVLLDCSHGYCQQCVNDQLQIDQEMGKEAASFKCLKSDCIRKMTTESVISAAEDGQEITSCPKCEKVCQQNDKMCTCESCDFVFCSECRAAYHGLELCAKERETVRKDKSKKKERKEKQQMAEKQKEETEEEEELKMELICKTCDFPVEMYDQVNKDRFFSFLFFWITSFFFRKKK